ncbi:hypothetical protein H4R18_000273 [Coemansia javaensis]|uniref:AAA-ATPase-like domain-containing protein n=1 Tax=Coemansia javaensis TaxID=2761396 RepID=A0A9W8HIX1_9FUNG|nr:hypothetical protein H4R18_000273 [Coemansia javaensis]
MSDQDRHQDKRARREAATVDWSLTRVHVSNESSAGAQCPQVVVDKTLLCKAFFDTESRVVRVCGPGGYGKGFAAGVVSRFFNVISKKDADPGSMYGYRGGAASVPYSADEARRRRLSGFESSLLRQELPAFFDEHFARYPVISLSFTNVGGSCLADFYRCMVWCIIHPLNSLAHGVDLGGLDDAQKSIVAKASGVHREYSGSHNKGNGFWEEKRDTIGQLFAQLTDMVAAVYGGRHIVVVDGYDVPLVVCRGEAWEEPARQTYMRLLGQIFEGNSNLAKGLLLGSHVFPLGTDGSLDMEGMSTIALSSSRNGDPQQQDPSMAALGLMFGLTRAEVAGVVEKFRRPLAKAGYSCEAALKAIEGSYGGYAHGHGEWRCRQGATIQLLTETANGGYSGRACLATRTIAGLINPRGGTPALEAAVHDALAKHQMAMALLACRVTHGFDAGETGCFVCASPEEVDGTTRFVLRETSFPADEAGVGDINYVVTLLVHTGYLAVGADGGLRIPNGMYRRRWEHIRLAATFGTMLTKAQYDQRIEFIDRLHRGDAGVLQEELLSAVSALSGEDEGEGEDESKGEGDGISAATRLEHACMYVASRLALARFSPGGRANVEYDRAFLRQVHDGRTSWAITLLPFGRYIQRLVVLVEFAHITPDDSSYEAGVALGHTALQTIVDQEQARPHAHCDIRLDVGVAVGPDMVVAAYRFWGRVGAGCAVERTGEPIAQWEERLGDSSAGWQDGLGWITQDIKG